MVGVEEIPFNDIDLLNTKIKIILIKPVLL
jgi:hypothetical protein